MNDAGLANHSKLIVFLAATPSAVGGVLLRVQRNLRLRGFHGVDTEHVAELDEVKEYIRDLAAHRFEFLWGKRAALFFRQPLEVFEQLARFHDQRGRQVLGRVELLPIAGLGKFALLLAKVLKGIGHGIDRGEVGNWMRYLSAIFAHLRTSEFSEQSRLGSRRGSPLQIKHNPAALGAGHTNQHRLLRRLFRVAEILIRVFGFAFQDAGLAGAAHAFAA